MRTRYVAAIIALLLGGFYYCSNRPVVDYYHLNYTQPQNEQAIEELEFPIKLPSYLPDQLTMRGGLIHVRNGKHRSFETRYLDSDNRGGFELYATEGSIDDVDLDRTQGFDWDEIAINGESGFIGRGQSDYHPTTQIIWETDSIRYQILSRELTEEELIKIARSFR